MVRVMGDLTCACGGTIVDHKKRDRRLTGVYVTLLLRCGSCGQMYQLHHFEQLRKCGKCGREDLRRTIPVPAERDAVGRMSVHYVCRDCGFEADQAERAPVAFRA
jgi:predicted RNA-binding Zn-ribbon protein involved in translation (DUF1610 family)